MFAAHAATYYLDPAAGAMTNPGSSNAPWSTLEAVVASGKPLVGGDVLYLRSGFHGSPTLRGTNATEVIICNQPGHEPALKSLTLRTARHWHIQGLTISPEKAPTYTRVTLVSVGSDAADILVEDCRLFSIENASGWSASDWDDLACDGISISGTRVTVRNNHLRNVDFGISSTGPSNLVQRNTIENFSGDGLRGLGDYDVFEYNTVKNCYAVNANHDDGFQSWSVGPGGVGTGVVRGVVLRGNRILNYEDPNQPFRGTLQGIGCFDGYYEDWVIENNEVLVDHWHGITLLGARNCRIVNNTVVDLNTGSPGPPWIEVGQHKDGTTGTGNLVRNNLSTDYLIAAGAATDDHNQVVTAYTNWFRDYLARDLRLRSGSPAIDAGSPSQAPSIDCSGVARPLDGNADGVPAWDLGAHEFAHPSADSDGDRALDAAELVAGTSPVDAGDVFQITRVRREPPGLVIDWGSVTGRIYSVVASPDLRMSSWSTISPADSVGTGGSLSYTSPVPLQLGQFYRLAVRAETP